MPSIATDRSIQALLIENNPGDAHLVQTMLVEVPTSSCGLPKFNLEWASCLADGLARLDEGGIDVVLIDLDLPDSPAEETCAALRAHAPQIPLVVLTGQESEELILRSVRAGAQDYLFKTEVTGSLLARTMWHAIERQQTEEALRANTKRLLRAQRVAKMGFLDWNLKTNEMIWSDQVYDLYGVDMQANKSNIDLTMQLVHPDDQEFVEQNLELAIQGRKEYDIDHRKLRPDGTVIWVHAQAELVRDADGNPASLLGTVVDITARKQAEEALDLRVKQLTALSQAAQVVNASLELDQVLAEIVSLASTATATDYTSVVLVDEAGRVGQTAENLPGVLAIEYRIRAEGLTNWIARSHQAVIIDEIGADGTIHPPLDAGAPHCINPVIAEAGFRSVASLPLLVKDHLLGVLHLHSQRPRAFHDQLAVLTAFASQAATAIANARLFAATQEAYEKLQRTQEQLTQSAKMAAVGTLAAGVAHEINNPMTIVLGLSELLLRDTAPDDPDYEDLVSITTEARRVRDIVRSLLDFSRQTASHREKTHINRVMQEPLTLVRQQLEKSGVILEEHYALDLPPLQLDVGRMRQVVLNLVTNAVQATSRGGRLTVSTARVGDEVTLRVADTGVGISVENLPRIFEPFFTTKPLGQGTGLGLSISRGIVHEHGGRITVESELGVGSTFTVWLPIEVAKEMGGEDAALEWQPLR